MPPGRAPRGGSLVRHAFAPRAEWQRVVRREKKYAPLLTRAMRGIIAALQDLGFIIERANEPLGLVTAARFAEPDNLSVVEVSVTIRPQADGRTLVRANAIYNRTPVADPKVYQNFFATLNRSLFINREE